MGGIIVFIGYLFYKNYRNKSVEGFNETNFIDSTTDSTGDLIVINKNLVNKLENTINSTADPIVINKNLVKKVEKIETKAVKKMYSMYNLFNNPDFLDTTNLNNLGQLEENSNIKKEIINTPQLIEQLPFNGNIVQYIMNDGVIVNLTLPELYEENMIFSYYVKKHPDSPDFEITTETKSETSGKVITQVSNNWQRIVLTQIQNTNFPFNVKITVPKTEQQKTFYISGLQLENNNIPQPLFKGQVFHTWDDVSPPEISYVYNLNNLSTIPLHLDKSNKLDIELLMSYDTINMDRTADNIGFVKQQSLHFDGKQTYMIIPATKLNPTTLDNFAVSFWIRFRQFTKDPMYQSIMGYWNKVDDYMMISELNGLIYVTMAKGELRFSHSFKTVNLLTNKWYFMALTIFNNKMRLYAYNFYEEVDIDGGLLSMPVGNDLYVGITPEYEQKIYKNYMLFADMGAISIWKRQLLPEDIKVLSRTFDDVKLAVPEIKDYKLVNSGINLPNLITNIKSIDGLGMCTYNIHINWNSPVLPIDYIKLGYSLKEYEAKLEYYVSGNLVTQDKIQMYINTEKITARVNDIKIFLPQPQCKECDMQVVNLPYDIDYKLYIRYVLNNGETSAWIERDLKYKDDLTKIFNISDNLTCQDKQFEIDPIDKLKGQQKQNEYIEIVKNRLSKLKIDF